MIAQGAIGLPAPVYVQPHYSMQRTVLYEVDATRKQLAEWPHHRQYYAHKAASTHIELLPKGHGQQHIATEGSTSTASSGKLAAFNGGVVSLGSQATANRESLGQTETAPSKRGAGCGKLGYNAVYYLHVPKCGGTFIREFMRHHVSQEQSGLKWCGFGADEHQRGVQMYGCQKGRQLEKEQVHFFTKEFPKTCNAASSHIDASVLDLVQSAHPSARIFTFTVVRNPVQQFISLYYHLRFKRQEPRLGTLEEFLDNHLDQRNRLTMMLVNWKGECFASAKRKAELAALTPLEVLRRAQLRIDRFCLVLMQEDPFLSLMLLNRALGWKLSDDKLSEQVTAVVNGNTVEGSGGQMYNVLLHTDNLMSRKVRKAQNLDMQLYAGLQQRFLSQVQTLI